MKKVFPFIIILLVCALGIGGFFAYQSYSSEVQIRNDLAAAAEKFNSGAYEDALQIYLKYQDKLDAAKYVDNCHYQLGKEAMTSKDWTEAKIHFSTIKADSFNDVEALIQQCDEEIARDNHADSEFLADLQKIIEERILLGSNTILDVATVSEEMQLMDAYLYKSFYDSQLSDYAKKIRVLLSQQVLADQQETRDMRQGYWYTAQAPLVDILKELNRTYGFMSDNTQFLQDYISNKDTVRVHADALELIQTDILTSMNNYGDWSENSNGLMYMTLHNSLNFRLGIKFYFALYNMSDQYIKTVEYQIDDIPPSSDYNVFLDLGNFREKFRSDFDWEVLSIQ